MFINKQIADLIYYIHYLLVLYILTGWYLTPFNYLKYYIILIIFIFLDWNDLDGQCILTRLEHYYRTGVWKQKSSIEEGGVEFFRPLLDSLFTYKFTRLEADRLNNFVFMLCLLFAFIRINKN